MHQSANADAITGDRGQWFHVEDDETGDVGRRQSHCASMVMAMRVRVVFSTYRIRDGQSSESAVEMAIKMRDTMLLVAIPRSINEVPYYATRL